MEKEYFSVDEAAEYLLITPQYLRNLLTAGKITAYQTEERGRVRFTKDQLDSYAKGEKVSESEA